MRNIIKTKIDPKVIRAEHGKVLVSDGGDFDVTAILDILDENVDTKTGIFNLKIGLHYPHRSSQPTIRLPNREDRTIIRATQPEYMLTQDDFDRIVKGEKITVRPYRPAVMAKKPSYLVYELDRHEKSAVLLVHFTFTEVVSDYLNKKIIGSPYHQTFTMPRHENGPPTER